MTSASLTTAVAFALASVVASSATAQEDDEVYRDVAVEEVSAADAVDPAHPETRRTVIRDLQTTTTQRPPRDAGIELNAAVDGENLVWWPWVASFSLLGAAILVDTLVEVPEPRWTGVGGADLSIAEGILLPAASARSRAASASDGLLVAGILATYLDAALWRQTSRSTSRTSYRLIMMDSLVFSMNTALVAIAKSTFQRQRPAGRFCSEDSDFGGCENRSLNRSFYSGHAATTFTAASLMCAHQRLRGQTPLGRIECVGSLALATTTSLLRMTAGKHYFSDIAVGAAIGFLLGYIFPIFIFPRRLPALPVERSMSDTARVWW